MRLNDRVKSFFFNEYDPASLGLFRIALGVFLLVSLIALFPNWEFYYGPHGFRPEPIGGWSVFVWTENYVSIQLFWWMGVTAALAFTVGYYTRLATVVLYLLQSSMNQVNPMAVHGDDLLIRFLLFYGIFSPLGDRFSVDSNFRNIKRGPALLWSLRLLQINIAAIYFFSLPEKLWADASWSNGDALYWVFMSSIWNRWPLQRWFYDGFLSHAMTFMTVAVEGLFPYLVWFRKTRLPILVLLALFHLGLAFFLQNVSFFSLSMFCAFFVFIPGEQVTALCEHHWPKAVGGRKFAKADCIISSNYQQEEIRNARQ